MRRRAAPLQLYRSFDLIISLEVAQHLPESCAHTFENTFAGTQLRDAQNVLLFARIVGLMADMLVLSKNGPSLPHALVTPKILALRLEASHP